MKNARLMVDFQNYGMKLSTTLSKYRLQCVIKNSTVFDHTRPHWSQKLVLENYGNIFVCGRDNEKNDLKNKKKYG